MQLDIRIPMGLMFTIIGVILAGYGLLTWSDAPLYQISLGYNVNFWWGLFLSAFGGTMLYFGRRAAPRENRAALPENEESAAP